MNKRLFVLAAVVIAIGTLGACSDTSPEPEIAEVASSAQVLTVRGVVRQLPAPGGVPFLVEHEAIPGFVDINGDPAPMDSMTMPFELADGSLLGDIAEGEKVVFDLEVDWNASPAIAVTRIERLAADTALELPVH